MRPQPQRLFQMPNRFWHLSLLKHSKAQVHVRFGILRLEPQRLRVLFNRFRNFALFKKSGSQAVVRFGEVRLELDGLVEILEGKRVVVWEFVERDIALGAEGWEEVPLPRRLQ